MGADKGERLWRKTRWGKTPIPFVFRPNLLPSSPPEITELPFLGLAPPLLRCASSVLIFLFTFHSGTRERRRERITSRNSLNRSPISHACRSIRSKAGRRSRSPKYVERNGKYEGNRQLRQNKSENIDFFVKDSGEIVCLKICLQ